MAEYTRRRILTRTAGLAAAGAIAGCTEGSTDGPGDGAGGSAAAVARSTFFVFGAFADAVAGDAAATDTLVPVGQHGHGWEPGPRVRQEIHDADLLVHGMEGFQPWADDVVGDLGADGENVTTVDVSEGVSLLEPGDHDEEDEHHHDDEDDEHDEDDHGPTDPHFWMDPLRASEAVENVRRGLVDVDGENEDVYAENADAYRNRLEDLHETIEATLAGASKDVVLLAGHDAFRYFGDRYGVEVEALTDVSPDAQVTPRAVERAQQVIDEHDLAYICADPLESQEAAQQLVDETDAEDVLPLTSMPGLNAEWDEADWGYVEVVENVNLPTLERALEA